MTLGRVSREADVKLAPLALESGVDNPRRDRSRDSCSIRGSYMQ